MNYVSTLLNMWFWVILFLHLKPGDSHAPLTWPKLRFSLARLSLSHRRKHWRVYSHILGVPMKPAKSARHDCIAVPRLSNDVIC